MVKRIKKLSSLNMAFPKMMRMPSSSDLFWLSPEQQLKNLSDELARTAPEVTPLSFKPHKKRK